MYNHFDLLRDKIPHNPLVNSGHLVSISQIFSEDRCDRQYEKYTEVVSNLIGNRKVGFNNEMCLAELETCHKNYCLAYVL